METTKVIISVDQTFASGKIESTILSVSEFHDLVPFDSVMSSFKDQVRFWLDHEICTGSHFDFHLSFEGNPNF